MRVHKNTAGFTNHYISKGKEVNINLRNFQGNCREWAERRENMTRSKEIRSKEIEEEIENPAQWTAVD